MIKIKIKIIIILIIIIIIIVINKTIFLIHFKNSNSKMKE